MVYGHSIESATAGDGRTIAVHLPAGTDLFEGLRSVCDREGVRQGFVISMVGSLEALSVVSVERRPNGTLGYGEPSLIEKPLELIAGQGTIGQENGALAIHLHGLTGDGRYLYGGHLVEGRPNRVLVTVEICLVALDGPSIERSPDDETGFRLFHVRP